MIARPVRVPKGILLLVAGLVFGIVWAAGSSPGTPVEAAGAGGKGGVSIGQGDGILASPNPITSTGTISARFGGDGTAVTVSRSDHTHDAQYVRQTGGIMSGDLAFTGNAQLIAPRIENASAGPVGAAAGRLYFDTAVLRLMVHDGTSWVPVPQFFSRQNFPVQTIGTPGPFQDLDCAVTFTLAADEIVLLDAGAVGELQNITVYTFGGSTLVNQIGMDLAVSFDGGSDQNLMSWSLGFTAVGTISQRKATTTVLFPLLAGTHTARLRASRSGTVLGSPLPATDYACRVSQLWLRIHRP